MIQWEFFTTNILIDFYSKECNRIILQLPTDIIVITKSQYCELIICILFSEVLMPIGFFFVKQVTSVVPSGAILARATSDRYKLR